MCLHTNPGTGSTSPGLDFPIRYVGGHAVDDNEHMAWTVAVLFIRNQRLSHSLLPGGSLSLGTRLLDFHVSSDVMPADDSGPKVVSAHSQAIPILESKDRSFMLRPGGMQTNQCYISTRTPAFLYLAPTLHSGSAMPVRFRKPSVAFPEDASKSI